MVEVVEISGGEGGHLLVGGGGGGAEEEAAAGRVVGTAVVAVAGICRG